MSLEFFIWSLAVEKSCSWWVWTTEMWADRTEHARNMEHNRFSHDSLYSSLWRLFPADSLGHSGMILSVKSIILCIINPTEIAAAEVHEWAYLLMITLKWKAETVSHHGRAFTFLQAFLKGLSVDALAYSGKSGSKPQRHREKRSEMK